MERGIELEMEMEMEMEMEKRRDAQGKVRYLNQNEIRSAE